MTIITLTALYALLTTFSLQPENIIRPEQAIQAVRRFWGQPSLAATVERLYYNSDRIHGYYYDVRVQDGPISQEYIVGAADGVIYSIRFLWPKSDGPPTLSSQQARMIAEDFLRRYYPPFTRRKWRIIPEKYWLQGGTYMFDWHEVLNEYGTEACWWLMVIVDGTTGKILQFAAPPDRVAGPTVPHITLEQAVSIAAQFTPNTSPEIPFDEVYLRLSEDKYGIQRLVWELCRNLQVDPTDPIPNEIVWLDAITGEVVRVKPKGVRSFGGGDGSAKLSPLRAPKYVVRPAVGQPLTPSVPPLLDKGSLWIRVELLRGLGARVQIDPKGVEIRAGERTLTGKALGAKLRDYGWWVPLRATARALGWRVDWVSAKREAVVHAPPAWAAGGPVPQ